MNEILELVTRSQLPGILLGWVLGLCSTILSEQIRWEREEAEAARFCEGMQRELLESFGQILSLNERTGAVSPLWISSARRAARTFERQSEIAFKLRKGNLASDIMKWFVISPAIVEELSTVRLRDSTYALPTYPGGIPPDWPEYREYAMKRATDHALVGNSMRKRLEKAYGLPARDARWVPTPPTQAPASSDRR